MKAPNAADIAVSDTRICPDPHTRLAIGAIEFWISFTGTSVAVRPNANAEKPTTYQMPTIVHVSRMASGIVRRALRVSSPAGTAASQSMHNSPIGSAARMPAQPPLQPANVTGASENVPSEIENPINVAAKA